MAARREVTKEVKGCRSTRHKSTGGLTSQGQYLLGGIPVYPNCSQILYRGSGSYRGRTHPNAARCPRREGPKTKKKEEKKKSLTSQGHDVLRGVPVHPWVYCYTVDLVVVGLVRIQRYRVVERKVKVDLVSLKIYLLARHGKME